MYAAGNGKNPGEVGIVARYLLGGRPFATGPMLNVSAQFVQNSVQVKWQTIRQINTAYFIIERSGDGRNFTTIGRKPASVRSILVTESYSFIDLQPLNPINFYRLKIVNADGSFTYSQVVAIKINDNSLLRIFPNPANDKFYVQVAGINENGTLQITDANGRQLRTEKVQLNVTSSFSIDIKYIPRGSYYLQVITKDKTQTIKFIRL